MAVANINNQEAFLTALRAGDPRAARRLLSDGGINVNPLNSSKDVIPLHVASSMGLAEIVQLLIEAGADVNILDGEKTTPLMVAAAKGHTLILRLLLTAGANVNMQNDDGWTALHDAAFAGHREAIRILLDGGADKALKDKTKMTAAAKARKYKHAAVAELIDSYNSPSSTKTQPSESVAAAPQTLPMPATIGLSSAAEQGGEKAGDSHSPTTNLQDLTESVNVPESSPANLRDSVESVNETVLKMSFSEREWLLAELASVRANHAEATAARDSIRAEHMLTLERVRALEAEQAKAQEEFQQGLRRLNEELTAARATIEQHAALSALASPQILASDIIINNTIPPLGNGANGEARVATWLGAEVVVKQLFLLRLDDLTEEEDLHLRNLLRREAEVLSRLRSPFLVTFFGYVCDDSGRPDKLVVERLSTVSREEAGRDAVRFCSNIAHALVYLHHRGVIHRDVKLSNILHDKERRVYKLSDLGEAQLLLGRDSATQTIRGSPVYHAPEVSDGGVRPTTAIDVFAFAVTVMEVYTGRSPAPTSMLVNRVVVDEIKRREGDLKRMAENSTKVLVMRCLAMNPEERPTARACAEHFTAQ